LIAYTGFAPVAAPTNTLSRPKTLFGNPGFVDSTSLVAMTTSGRASPSSSAIAGEVMISAPGKPGDESFTGNPGSRSPSPSHA
jgi:hypothetical protein